VAIERSSSTFSIHLHTDFTTGRVDPDLFDFDLVTADHKQGPGARVPKELVERLLKDRQTEMNPDMRAVLLFVDELNVYRVAFQNLDNHEDPEENGHGDMEADRFEEQVAKLMAFRQA